MDPVHVVGSQAQERFLVYPRKPRLTDLHISRRDDFKALAGRLGSRISDEDLGISKSDPNELEDLRNETIEKRRGAFRKLSNDQHSSNTPTLLSFGLKPFESGLNFAFHQLGSQSTARLRQTAERFGRIFQHQDVAAAEGAAQVTRKPGSLLSRIHAIEIDQPVQGQQTTNPLVSIAAGDDELGDALTDCVVEFKELLRGAIWMRRTESSAKTAGSPMAEPYLLRGQRHSHKVQTKLSRVFPHAWTSGQGRASE
jgi:hypothetical protein